MKITQNTERETVGMVVDVQNLGVRKLFPQAKILWEEKERM